MRNIIFIVLCCIATLSRQVSHAQFYYTSTEYGLALGGTQYFGDLNNNYSFKTVSPSYGVYIRLHLNQFIAVKLVTNFTHVGFDDKYNTNPYEKMRNLNFESNIYEAVLQSEFNFFRFVTGDPYHRFTPYLTGGIGIFYYDPYTFHSGQKIYLKPLGTEGQNAGYDARKYDNYSPCFPIGAGVKFWLTGGINLSLEVADRLTTTSYLDDVSNTYVGIDKFKPNSVAAALQDRSGELSGSNALGRAGKQRGNTSRKDQYLMGIFSFSWHFKTYHCPAGLNDDMIRVRRR